MRKILKYFLLLSLVPAVCGCSVARRVPEGSYLLAKNKIVEDKTVPRKERIKAEEVEKYIQLTPNRRLLGTNLYLQLYNTASPDTTKKNWINRTLRNWGDPPVLYADSLSQVSADLIHNYVQYSGYYNSDVWFTVDTSRRKKAKVKYHIVQNEPYRIGGINWEFDDELLRQVIMEDSVLTLLRSGDVLDGNVLTAEKERITKYLRNSGYYDFTQRYVDFFGDATDDPDVKDVTVELKQIVSDYTNMGEALYENNSIYRISKIIINPQYDPALAAQEDYYEKMDTTEYRGLYILHPRGRSPRVRAEILRQVVNLYPNYIYDEEEVMRARLNIMRLGSYRSADIIFRKVDTDDDMIITFVGGDEEDESLEYTTEKYLECHINCIPALRQGYKIELEGATTSSFNSITATVGYQNRNLFQGAELFEAAFRGGYEFMRTKGQRGAFEVGGAVSVSFPRFITPFKVDRYNKLVNPRTKVELSINTQNRRFYKRTLSGANWGYSWSNPGRSSFALRPVGLNLIKIGYRDEDFISTLGPYLQSSFEDQLAGGISGSYTYNSQSGMTFMGRKSFIFRFNWETAGNFFNLATRILSDKKTNNAGEQYYKIFGIRYAQYFRVDGSISDRIILGPKTNIAFRFYGGVGQAYSNASSLPYDRLFYAGGSNSMRGWIPRKLGPGNAPIENDRYPSQVGNMKLEANAEIRFPVWSLLQGALFFDVGNIWYLKNSGESEESLFKLNRFYKQLGLNTGLGFRFDINVTVIRIDVGYKLHNPNEVAGRRWVNRFKLTDSVINFGVGYPF